MPVTRLGLFGVVVSHPSQVQRPQAVLWNQGSDLRTGCSGGRDWRSAFFGRYGKGL
ncbi:hypothetical protein I79_003590 [Cricetulus griseus]|uniref:Uncharacterized protein n=1 Tax=Cricetulus griseus TaxID=10029 RepID=G3H0D5_CRIGR|nr:hypothetical protein I79_003590 [Cricetulus griseus]